MGTYCVFRKQARTESFTSTPQSICGCVDVTAAAEHVLCVQQPYCLKDTALNIGEGITVLKCSDEFGWSNLSVSLVAGSPHDYEVAHRAVPDLWINMSLDPLDLLLTVDMKEERLIAPSHRVSIVAPGTAIGSRWRNKGRILHVFVKKEIVAEVASELFDRDADRVEIVSAFAIEDLSMSLLMLSLQQALVEPQEHSDLKVEYVSRALTADILRKHSALRRIGDEAIVGERLTTSQARRVTEYIRDCLSTELLLKDLANLVGLSRSTFIKRFKASFHQTPHQYVMKMRVRQAQELLANTDLPAVDIAAACGFADQAHLSGSFKRLMGVTPSSYRQKMR